MLEEVTSETAALTQAASAFQRGRSNRKSFQKATTAGNSITAAGNAIGQSGPAANGNSIHANQQPQQQQQQDDQVPNEEVNLPAKDPAAVATAGGKPVGKPDKKISAAGRIAKGFGLKREKSQKSNGSNSSTASAHQPTVSVLLLL